MLSQNCLKFHSPNGSACEITFHNFEISLAVFMPNITTNHAITHTNRKYNNLLWNYVSNDSARFPSATKENLHISCRARKILFIFLLVLTLKAFRTYLCDLSLKRVWAVLARLSNSLFNHLRRKGFSLMTNSSWLHVYSWGAGFREK